MRKKKDIEELILSIQKDNENIRKNKSNWKDSTIPMSMIRDNNTRVHTLQWVLGQHTRFD